MLKTETNGKDTLATAYIGVTDPGAHLTMPLNLKILCRSGEQSKNYKAPWEWLHLRLQRFPHSTSQQAECKP